MTDERDDERESQESPREGGASESQGGQNDSSESHEDDSVVEVGGHGAEAHDDLTDIDEVDHSRAPSGPDSASSPVVEGESRPAPSEREDRRPDLRRGDARPEVRRDERRSDGRRGGGRQEPRRQDGRRDEKRPDGRNDGRNDGRRDPRAEVRGDSRQDPRREPPRSEVRQEPRRDERRDDPRDLPEDQLEGMTDADGIRDLKRAGRHEPTPEELLPPDDDERHREGEGENSDREWHMVEEVDEGRPNTAPNPRERERDRGRGRGRGRDRDRDRDRDRGSRDVEELGASTSGIDVLDLPRGGERRRGIEPGVSLRDLMPFLRPPKHVVVLGASTGGGHTRVSHAVTESLRTLDRNMNLRELDLLDLLADEFRPAYVRAVLDDLARRPALFGVPFETSNPAESDLLPPDIDDFLRTAFAERLQQALLDRRPEWVVATHWLAFRWLEAADKDGVAIPKVIAVVSDPEIHELWFSPVVKHWLVPSMDVERRLMARGIPREAIFVTGLPVNPAFSAPIHRDDVRRGLGLRRDLPTILVRPGGIGSVERITAVVTRLLATAAPMNLLIVAGKNDRLRESLEALTVPDSMMMKAFAFVDNIHELMAVSDLLVTRATPHTVAEAQASVLPMLLLRPAAGVEERLADRLLSTGVALIARDDATLEAELVDLLANRRRMKAMRERMMASERPDGTTDTVERLTRLIR